MMTRNRRESALRSLAKLSTLAEDGVTPPIILVDNGSTDGTPQAVRRRFPQVRVIALPENQGSPARTLGVRAADTPYVAFADDDSWWAPGSLRQAADVLDTHLRLGLLAARILIGPDSRLDPICGEMAASPLPTAPDAAGPAVLGFVACAAVVRRAAFLAAGGFSPVLFFFGEETLLALDLLAAGWQLSYVDDVVAHHDPASVVAARSGRDRLAVRNALLTIWMRRPTRVAVRETAGLVFARRHCGGPAGLLDAVARSRQALAHRRLLPPSVEAQARLLESSRAG